MENSLVANRFRIGRRIGPNTFSATDTETNEEVAVKFESVNATVPKLHIESNSYKALQHSSRIPDAMHFGVKGENKYLVMTLLGPNLEYLFKQCNRKFSLKTVLMLAFQMVHAIGLGLSKRFRDSTVEHIPFRENRLLVGTIRFASMYALSGSEQSRRDDLESLGYVLMYFLRGSLPWQGLIAANLIEKLKKIRQMKVSIKALCEGYPPEFEEYFNYVRSLRFDDKPEYSYLKTIFRELFAREGFCLDYLFEWHIKKERA